MPAAVAGPVKATRYQPTVPLKSDSSGRGSKTCGTVAGCQFEPKRPLCQFSLRPRSLRSGANCQPCESWTGGGGPAASAPLGHASATTTAASTKGRTRDTWDHMMA